MVIRAYTAGEISLDKAAASRTNSPAHTPSACGPLETTRPPFLKPKTPFFDALSSRSLNFGGFVSL